MKEVYQALEALEGGAELVKLVKDQVAKANDAEARIRQYEKQVEGVDISELKALKDFADKLGGVNGISDALQKASADESEKKRLSELVAKHDQDKNDLRKQTEQFEIQMKRLQIENRVQPYFVENFNSGQNLMKIALDSGMIVEGESGLCFKSGDTLKPLDGGGWEDLKQHSDMKWALKTPAGGGVGGGVNGGKTESTAKVRNPFA